MTDMVLVPTLSLFLLQAPGDGWGMAPGKPGEVKHLYWDLFNTTEVWVQVRPERPDGKGLTPLQLVFQAFYTGREAKGAPARVGARVVGPTIDFSFRLTYDGKTADLTGPQGNSRFLWGAPACDDCNPNGVDAEIKIDVMRDYAAAVSPGGVALGIPFVLSAADRIALRTFAAQLGPRK